MKTCKQKECKKETKNKFCSPDCYHKDSKGKKRKKSGKNINCKNCKKEFYISPSRFNIKKYCSRECAKKDEYGFKEKQKKCVICSEKFSITKYIEVQKKTCSSECSYELSRKISAKSIEKRKNIDEEYKCKKCKCKFKAPSHFKRVYCSDSCQHKDYAEKRINEGNPNYRGGYFTKKNFTASIAHKHSQACQKYRKAFLEKNNYLFCEVCGVNSNGTIKHDVHHIYFASRVPRHEHLHNFKNLVLVCRECHLDFHGKRKEEEFKKLEKDRGLKKLFNLKDNK